MDVTRWWRQINENAAEVSVYEDDYQRENRTGQRDELEIVLLNLWGGFNAVINYDNINWK